MDRQALSQALTKFGDELAELHKDALLPTASAEKQAEAVAYYKMLILSLFKYIEQLDMYYKTRPVVRKSTVAACLDISDHIEKLVDDPDWSTFDDTGSVER